MLGLISLVCAVVSLLGLAAFWFYPQSAPLFWINAGLAFGAIVIGAMDRKSPRGRLGLGLGAIAALICVVLMLWLSGNRVA